MAADRTPPDAATLPKLRAFEDLYCDSKAAAPVLDAIDGEKVPEPYRKLLVHEGDMTPALERFHGDGIHLQVLRSNRTKDQYSRDVVLRADGTRKPVEFGAIEINLAAVHDIAREAILQGRRPLGAILRDFSIAHLSRPKAYFRVKADDVIRRSLELNGAAEILYGRRNTLLIPSGAVLAEIIEILPP
jgi:chorismate-pyruvate lyase